MYSVELRFPHYLLIAIHKAPQNMISAFLFPVLSFDFEDGKKFMSFTICLSSAWDVGLGRNYCCQNVGHLYRDPYYDYGRKPTIMTRIYHKSRQIPCGAICLRSWSCLDRCSDQVRNPKPRYQTRGTCLLVASTRKLISTIPDFSLNRSWTGMAPNPKPPFLFRKETKSLRPQSSLSESP